MELKILSIKNEEKGKVNMPEQFNEKVRPDLIKKVVLALQSSKRQQYGADPEAGKRHSTEISKRRREYRGSYGLGISRVPRKILSKRGTRMNWVGALAPGTVGGRQAHPPKAEKIWSRKINKKENRKAIRGALAATLQKQAVDKRGHKAPENYPFIIEEKFESVEKTKEVYKALKELGFSDELKRTLKKKVRAGKGKMRGRKYKRKKGALLVVSDKCKLEHAAKNLAGIDVVKVNELNVEMLAPGAMPGRLALFTEKAIEKLRKDKLFM